MEWISIEKQLPEDYFYVLVYAQFRNSDEPEPISIARRCDGKWELVCMCPESNAVAKGDLTWFIYPEEITHWMPLPNAPRG